MLANHPEATDLTIRGEAGFGFDRSRPRRRHSLTRECRVRKDEATRGYIGDPRMGLAPAARTICTSG